MRLFIAIDFPETIKRSLSGISFELVRQADAGRMVPAENFHITLAFIGETDRMRDIEKVMAAVCGSGVVAAPPLRLALRGVGSFKGQRGHTWWVGIGENTGLSRLADSLAAELRAEGFAIEKRAFKPHITIGRGVVTSRPVDLALLEPAGLECEAASVSLMRSDHKNGRQVYSELFACDL